MMLNQVPVQWARSTHKQARNYSNVATEATLMLQKQDKCMGYLSWADWQVPFESDLRKINRRFSGKGIGRHGVLSQGQGSRGKEL